MTFNNYRDARDWAYEEVRYSGNPYGVAHNKLFKEWSVFRLPSKEKRTGYELRCEAVEPWPGCGPQQPTKEAT